MISVIIPTYNGEKFVKQCLDAVFAQTISKDLLEVIVVDDASTDGTVKLLKEYEKEHEENMTLILCEKNGSETLEVTRNIGMEYARGEYILFLDQDDWYRPDAFEILHEKMEEDSTLDYIEYLFYYTDFEGNITEISCENIQGYYKFDASCEADRLELARRGILPGATFVWSKIYRKSFLLENNIYHNDREKRTGYSDNFFSGLVVTCCKKYAKYFEPLYFYRDYIGSYSHAAKINDKNQLERYKAGIAFWEECKERGFFLEKREFVEYIFMRIFLLKTFITYINNFDPIQYEVLAYMQKFILENCPHYYENTIMVARNEFKALFELLEYEWDPVVLDVIKKSINNK